MAEVFNRTPQEFIDINTMFDVLNNRVGFEASQLKAIVENTYWLYNYALEFHIPPDAAMSDTSTNAVQNKVIKAYVDSATSGLATLENTLTNTRKNAVRVKLSSSDFERIDITPLEWSLSDTTQAEDCEISKLWLQTPTEYMTCHLKDATARAYISNLETRTGALETELEKVDNWATSFHEALNKQGDNINTLEEYLTRTQGQVELLDRKIGDLDAILTKLNTGEGV